MDHIKYDELTEKRTMRWHPLVIRWSLCTFQRVNTAGWAELREVFNLPSTTSIRARKNHNSTPGIDHEVLKLQEQVGPPPQHRRRCAAPTTDRRCAAVRCRWPTPTSSPNGTGPVSSRLTE